MESKIPKLDLELHSKNLFINDIIKNNNGANTLKFYDEMSIDTMSVLNKLILLDLVVIVLEYCQTIYSVRYNINRNIHNYITFESDNDIVFNFSIVHNYEFQNTNKNKKKVSLLYMSFNKPFNYRMFDNIIKETKVQTLYWKSVDMVYDCDSIYGNLFNFSLYIINTFFKSIFEKCAI